MGECYIGVNNQIRKIKARYIVENGKIVEIAPVVHGHWIEEHGQTLIPVEYDDFGNLVLHDYTTYRCNLCGRTENKKEPYCNCGARMDGDDNE